MFWGDSPSPSCLAPREPWAPRQPCSPLCAPLRTLPLLPLLLVLAPLLLLLLLLPARLGAVREARWAAYERVT